MQGFHPAAAAFLPGARPLHQSKKPGPKPGGSADRQTPLYTSSGHAWPPDSNLLVPSYSSSMLMPGQTFQQPSHQVSSPPGPSSQGFRPPVLPSRPHVPFLYPRSASNYGLLTAGTYVEHPGLQSDMATPRPYHDARPSLSMRIPSNPTYQPRLSPRMHSPSESKAATAYSPQGLPLRRHVPVRMPPCKLWTRRALPLSQSQTIENSMRDDLAFLLLDAVSRPQHEDEASANGLPESIDIYLPGALAWMDMLEQLIRERPLGTPIPHDLLSFKLNTLKGDPVILASPKTLFSPASGIALGQHEFCPSSSMQGSPTTAAQISTSSMSTPSIVAPEFKPRLNPTAPVFSLKPTAPVFTPKMLAPAASPVIVDGIMEEEEGTHNNEKGAGPGAFTHEANYSYASKGSESESATNPSDEENSLSEYSIDGDNEPLAHLAARQRNNTSGPAMLLRPLSSAASRSSFSSASDLPDDLERISRISDDEIGTEDGQISRSSRASEAIRRAVSQQGRRLSEQPPDPDPWLEGKEELMAVQHSLRKSFLKSKFNIDAAEVRPAATPLPPSAFDCSDSGSEPQWFEGPSEPHSRRNTEGTIESTKEEQVGKDNMRSFKFPETPKLNDSAFHYQQHHNTTSDSINKLYRGHTVQPSGLVKSLVADPQGTDYIPRNSPESRRDNKVREGPLPSLFEGELLYHQRLMSYGEDLALSDPTRGQETISHALPLSDLHKLEDKRVNRRSRSNTHTSFETDPSNFQEDPHMPANWRPFEIFLEGKLNDLRQDLTGFSALRADLDSLKRDALVDILVEQLDKKLAELKVCIDLNSRSDLSEESLRQISALLEDTSRRTVNHALSSISIPQLHATISEEEKEGLVHAVVAASNSSTFSPLVNLQGLVDQLQVTNLATAKQFEQIEKASKELSKANAPLDVASLVGMLVEEARSAQTDHLQNHTLSLLREFLAKEVSVAPTPDQIQADFQKTKAQLSEMSGSLPNSMVETVQHALAKEFKHYHGTSDARLQEFINRTKVLENASDQQYKLIKAACDNLLSATAELRELLSSSREKPTLVDFKSIVQLEMSNRDLAERLSSSEAALKEKAALHCKQAAEIQRLQRQLQELEAIMHSKNEKIEWMKLQQEQKASDERTSWQEHTTVLEKRLKEQDERIIVLAQGSGRNELLQEQLQKALRSETHAREELCEVEAELVDVKIASSREAREVGGKLEAAHRRVLELEADLEAYRSAPEGMRGLSSASSFSATESSATPPFGPSGFTDNRQNQEHAASDMAKPATRMALAITLPHVPRPSDDGWWS